MPQQVDECPYCGGTFPHQGPTGCPPIKWPSEPKRFTEWHVHQVDGDQVPCRDDHSEPCIHPGVSSTKHGDGSGPDTEHCWTCGRDVPYTEL